MKRDPKERSKVTRACGEDQGILVPGSTLAISHFDNAKSTYYQTTSA
jgi:hypothetical protein